MHRPRLTASAAIVTIALLAAALIPGSVALAAPKDGPLGHFKHIVVIYEENHSFDNLYGLWGSVGGVAVEGVSSADAAHTTQVAQDGTAYNCLLMSDVNLMSPPLSADCSSSTFSFGTGKPTTAYHFGNAPYNIDQYIPATANTCPDENSLFANTFGILDPAGLPGGCTRDLVHRFYQEQYQLDGGNQDRYVTGSDSAGMTMGYYDTTALPIYTYLHQNGAPNYVIADHFFQGAFGGSFLNHQYLIAAAALPWPAATATQHSLLDANGFPNATYPLYVPTTTVRDAAATQACGLTTTVAGFACGDLAVNTVQPWYQPTSAFGAKVPPVTSQTTIGDELSAKGVSWAWYSGGWDDANGNVGGRGYTNGDGTSCTNPNSAPAPVDAVGNGGAPYCPDKSFQTHHQPFNYYANFAPGTPGRAHLQDEQDFLHAVQTSALPAVSFVKPLGLENEHPGYASEANGSDHLVNLIQAIETGPEAGNTLIVVTYDEFGGQWDHVPPPGLGTTGASDSFGPGTRIPALVIGRSLTTSTVDHTVYDTTSILATIEHQFELTALSADTRDGRVSDLGPAISAGRNGH